MSTDVLIVGGGMTGLATALALNRRGVGVRVLERTSGRRRGGAGLGVDLRLLGQVTGLPTADLPVLRDGHYDLAAWSDLYAWLSAGVRRLGIPVEYGLEVVAASAETATVVLEDGEARRGTLVIGADGVHSALRRVVAPEQPLAAYAGYLLWRGLVPERDLPPGTPLPAERDTFQVHHAPGFRLVAYAVPGAGGGSGPGERRLAFAWYDARPHPALPGQLEGRFDTSFDMVFDTVASETLPAALQRDLAETARAVWPSPWGGVIAHAFATGGAFGTPIAEYLPRRLVSGAVALVGDAAHAVTPMTGAGLHTGLLDVLALGAALARYGPSRRALNAYETERLEPDRRLVEQGQRLGRSYLDSVGA